MKEYEIFGERMKVAMKRINRMKQSELAEITGITEVTISRYINSQRVPKVTEILKIADALDVSCDYLMGKDEDFNGKDKGVIYTERALQYCKECADGWCDFYKKALNNIGNGDSHSSSFGAVSFGMQKEEMYRYEIPNIIKFLSTLN